VNPIISSAVIALLMMAKANVVRAPTIARIPALVVFQLVPVILILFLINVNLIVSVKLRSKINQIFITSK
jgi:hypothetical protein